MLVDVGHSGGIYTNSRAGCQRGMKRIVAAAEDYDACHSSIPTHRRFFPTQSSIFVSALFRFSSELATLKRR